jgi:hypothetical protein
MTRTVFRAFAWLSVAISAMAQAPAPARFVGTVTAIKVDTAEFVIKTDTAGAATVKLSSETVAERVEPGAKDLKSAQAMKASDIAVGDRVLVVLMPDSNIMRRIVDMSAVDITKRNEADRADWNKRGIAGVVAAKKGNEITLKMRSMQGEVQATVTVSDKTAYRRYAPDSVKFAEAKISKLDEVSVGDQLRSRGQKSEDGLKVTADDVVFGTFLTKAGSIIAVNAETREITVKELGTNKPLVIKVTADSQLKQMPNMPAMPGGAPGGNPGGAPGGSATAPRPVTPGPGGAQTAGGPPRTMPDIGQMIERLPVTKLEDLKPGITIVVSSTKGAKEDQFTAITLLANADMLIRMASMMAGGAARPPGMGAGAGPSLSGLAMDIPAITP